jgi:DNA-binding NarL/FixJ family response regulator
MKAEAVDNIIVAIRQIFNGGVYLSSKMRSRIVEKVAGLKTPSDESILHTLSDREFEIFQLVGKGYKTSSIASTLNLSIKTIET